MNEANMEKIKKIVIAVILLAIALFILNLFISAKYEKWETRQRFVDNISKECANEVSSSSHGYYSSASAYLNAIGLKVEEETFIIIVDKCAQFQQ